MAKKESYLYPVIAEGDWGCAVSRSLKNKLLCYFQSLEKSGGGECKIEPTPGNQEQITVYFAAEEVRQRVLGIKMHELHLPENKTLKLTVSLPATTVAANENESPGELDSNLDLIPANEPPKPDAQEVLQRKSHLVNKTALHIRQNQQETAQDPPQMSTSLVVLENVQESMEQCMLVFLVENVSFLSEEDNDFIVEMIPERNAAVITLFKPTELDLFISVFNQHHRVKQLNISAHSLEVTKSVRVENIPPAISRDFIIIYFESKKHGGGPVLDANYLPDQNSAIITFQDSKDVSTVLAQKHSFSQVPIFVYPYYASLGSALYGKEGPEIQMPDPVSVSLDPYYWQFLQQHGRLLQEINHEMAKCYCEIEWPTGHCIQPEIKIHPFHPLSRLKRSFVKSWTEDVSNRFAQILSKQKVVKCEVNAEVWEAIRNSIVKDDLWIFPDIPKGILVMVGTAEATDHAEQEIKVLIGNAVKKIERERQTIEETMAVVAGKYSLLNNVGLQETIRLEYPDIKIAYESSKERITLRGIAAEVFKIKSDLLIKISSMVQKPVDVHPYILHFLQHVDNETVSQLLFWTKNINVFFELEESSVLLTGISPHDLLQAEEEMKEALAYKCIELEDQSIVRNREWRELTSSLYNAYNCSSASVIIEELAGQIVIAGCFTEVADANQKLSAFVDSNTYVQKTIRAKSEAVVMYVEQEKRSIWLGLTQKGVKIHFDTRTNQKLISLEGSRVEVMKGLDCLQNVLSSLYAKRILIDKPGVEAFFKEQEHLYVTCAKQQFNCLIRIQEGSEKYEEEEEHEVENVSEERGPPYCEVKLGDGTVVSICKGNLTRYLTDVVVNASNEELKHIGGLAYALSQAAGPQLQRECDDLVRKHGPVWPGCAVITGAGNLPCKQVIHAVGPRWDSSEKDKCVRLLKKAVRESLQLAESYNHRSIAIPAISSGVFGFPLKECASSIVTAIKETTGKKSGSDCLKQIDLVDLQEDTIRALTDAMKEVFRDELSSSKWSSNYKTEKHPTKSKTEHQGVTTGEGLKIIVQKKGIKDATQSQQTWQNVEEEELSSCKWSSNSHTEKHPTKSNMEHQGVTTGEGLKIILQKKRIEDATTDVIVNSIGSDLQLHQGPLSKALLSKAGAELQVELTKQVKGKEIKEGCVLSTNGYALACSWVLHAILPGWTKTQQSPDKVLGEIIKQCLTFTEQHSLNSITIPAIGTGNLGFPKPVVAKLMFDVVFKFSKEKNPRSLQEVHFVLHPTDSKTIEAFTDELHSRLNLNQESSSVYKTVPDRFQQSQAFFRRISTSTSGGYKMQIGSITLQIASGDITQETTDVIVNISNEAFNLKDELAGFGVEDVSTSDFSTKDKDQAPRIEKKIKQPYFIQMTYITGVSKAILEGAGLEVETECVQLASQPHNNLICTQGGNLRCKNVIHLVAQNNIRAQVSKVLMECEQRQFISVAFPATGTGKAGRDPATVADDRIDAIVNFAEKTSAPVVTDIKIILFQPHLQSVFHSSIQKKEHTVSRPDLRPSKSVAELFNFGKHAAERKSPVLLEKMVKPTVFQICGENQKNVENAESWLKNLILKEQNEITLSDACISNFEESEYEKLRVLQMKLHVVIELKVGDSTPSLHILGITRDVLSASLEVQKMIQKVREAQEELSKADFLSNVVEWQYEHNGQYKPFDSLANMHIELSAQQQRLQEVTIENKHYRVDPSKLQATDDQGTSINLQRISKTEDKSPMMLPQEWEDMQQKRVKVVELKPEMPEYQAVQRMFRQTCASFTIEKIERIQNPYCWQAYQIKKQEMDAKNGHTCNEKLLFHGTAGSSLNLINNSGFNRSYAGMHAAAYGNGTYFAVGANYSAQDVYSKPDFNGKKYMYLARVLVGEYCPGSKGLIVPKAKDSTDLTNLFDSVTDNVTRPSMFIIFNDIQAYPEYLITFRK